ncbi:TPR repeat-containing protein [Caballeronia glebae]|uniref:TPR repeat-containing protein n=1 Tax=Caballeronia glebae TaxID=1777143 RepID=A0A158AGV5_9BURK|nr:tetratricopeptide repeat protein [Caballeronia glebae]SAK57018.1 TPR repeat-containing protein [Caballeronia glebae]
MSITDQYPSQTQLITFREFVCHAVAADRDGDARAREIWLAAAAKLHPVSDDALDALLLHLTSFSAGDDAVAIAEAFVKLYPANARSHFRLGLTFQLLDRHEEALAPYRAALAIDPEALNLRNNLASALITLKRSNQEAKQLLEAALDRAPDDVNATINIARVHLRSFDLDAAMQAEEKAERMQPESAVLMSNRSQTLREAQRWEDAERYAAAALQRDPGNRMYLWNLGMIHLLRGNYADGWREHEARWDGSSELRGRRPVLPGPTWRGEPLAGKTLLLWGEQGMGDLLQFCRYVPMLAAHVHSQGGRLAWNSFPQMGGLVARSLARHADEFTLGGGVESLPHFDYELSLVTLPLVFGTQLETIPADVPYLHPDPQSVEQWRKRLGSEPRLKVGLTWTGSLTHQRNPYRRVGLERYVDYFRDLGNVAFYSLQPGAHAEVAAARSAGLDIADHSSEFSTFDDTAAFIGALDLVISVCTSAAHLSGAIGQRTWVLLDVNPHWTWLTDRTDSPWYPTATLYRQTRFGDWTGPMERISRDLAELAEKHCAA